MAISISKGEEKKDEAPQGCTRFCKLSYYKQYFNIGETEVISRIKASITLPPT